MSRRSSYQIRALERALDILEVFSIDEPEFTLAEITARTGLAKTTVFRLLTILEARGYLEQSPDTDRYRIGIRTFELGSIYIQTITLATEAQPSLRRLARECRHTANLGILDQGEIVHIAIVAPDRPIRFHDVVGSREPAHCTGLGKALLTGLSERDLDEFITLHGLPRRTENTITDPAKLRAQLAAAREQGFAVDDEEAYSGLRCVAAPVYNDKNQVAAAVSISGPAFELRDEELPPLIQQVITAAREISQRLGHGVHLAAAGK